MKHEMKDRGRIERSPREESLVEKVERSQTGRRSPRVPMGRSGTLSVPRHLQEEGYVYFWEVDNRVQERIAAYWEFVLDNGERVTTPSKDGFTLHLMKLLKEYDDEDKAYARERISRTEREINQVKPGEYATREVGGINPLKQDRDLY